MSIRGFKAPLVPIVATMLAGCTPGTIVYDDATRPLDARDSMPGTDITADRDAPTDLQFDLGVDTAPDVPGTDAADASVDRVDVVDVPLPIDVPVPVDVPPPVDSGPMFLPVLEPTPLPSVAGLFTTGGQYRDPGNGVLQDSWSMLVRWQGAGFVTNPVSYDLGVFTGLHVPAPATTWQRGPVPEDPTGSPGVQLYDNRAGLVINTAFVPHRYIEGGGYNDMYGYAWSAARRPDAFVVRDTAGTVVGTADLVLQSDLAVPTFVSSALVSGTWMTAPAGSTGMYADGQVALFAYLEDTTHPTLPPIAYVALAWGNRWTGCPAGGRGFAGFDYPTGVWFGAAGLCTTDVSTVVYSTPTIAATFTTEQFFRIHITTTNWQNLIARINSAGPANPDPSLQCTPGLSCPTNGYSSRVEDYRIQYAGVIAETVLLVGGAPANDTPDRQVMFGASVHGFGIYRYR